jgi:hypothetical protein
MTTNRIFDEMPALAPLDFFTLAAHGSYSKQPPTLKQMRRSFSLPDTSAMLGEEHFVDVAVSWNEEGLNVAVWVQKPFEEACYPQFAKGDAFELFIDTRDLKTAGFMTRFCHHFLILPQEVQGIRALEITRFRTEDSHPLSDPAELIVESGFDQTAYWLQIYLPAHCLHAFDPLQFDRLGFNYRCHRPHGMPQHFSVSSQDYPIEQYPRLWGTLKLQRS